MMCHDTGHSSSEFFDSSKTAKIDKDGAVLTEYKP